MYLLEVYVTNANLNVNKPFSYCSDVPVALYKRVKVFFNNAYNMALVVNCFVLNDKEQYETEKGYKLLKIIEVVDEQPIISQELYDLAIWLSKTTLSPLIACINTMLPKILKTSKNINNPKFVQRIKINNNKDIKLTKHQQELLSKLHDGLLLSQARKYSLSTVNTLINKGVICPYTIEAEYEDDYIEKKAFKILTSEQEVAYQKIINTDKMITLLFGITGSGKTEVYLHLARYYLKQNKDVLIMVPEISLTPQMIERVQERFQNVIFYHSQLNDQERYQQYKRVNKNKGVIVVGTRSSIFLPFRNLGIVIIDEEHDSSYKQDNIPTYHAKNVAIKRALFHHAKVLLASATPSLDTYSRALKNEYEFVELKNRINNNLPEIKIVDLIKSIKKNNTYIISEELKEEIQICLNNNKQALILLNRRGYSPIVKCSECGITLMCNDCDTPLNYHKDLNVLKCHQCSKTYQIPDRCPNCHNKSLIYYGFGTMKVEEELKSLFPSANIERMDRDNVSKKDAHKAILKRLAKGEIDILIGTQMIAKGLDYPDVTLVGILNADAGLMHQDYNCTKTTFDLLMQASGRSGRADSPGKVIIQAFNVKHYLIKAVLNQDYNYFYRIEMNYRSKTYYPPFSHILEIFISDENPKRLEKSVSFLADRINSLKYKKYRPYELPKLKKNYRYRILLMDKKLVDMINDVQIILNDYLSHNNLSKIKCDIDPLYLE